MMSSHLLELPTNELWIVVNKLDVVSGVYLRNANTFLRDSILAPPALRLNLYVRSQILGLIWRDRDHTLRMMPRGPCSPKCPDAQRDAKGNVSCYVCRCTRHEPHYVHCGKSICPRQASVWSRWTGQRRRQHNYVGGTLMQETVNGKTIEQGPPNLETVKQETAKKNTV